MASKAADRRKMLCFHLKESEMKAVESCLKGMKMATWIREIAIRNELERQGYTATKIYHESTSGHCASETIYTLRPAE